MEPDRSAATRRPRDGVADLVRAGAIVVVVLWHWVLSVNHWSAAGTLAMPNPLGEVPGSWALTWVLQVVPLFFLVGGYVHRATWARDAAGRGTFVRRRLRRLWGAVAVWAALVVAVDVAARSAVPAYPGLGWWGGAVVAPLWFLGVYSGIVVLVPVTLRWHERSGALAPLAAALGVLAAGEVARRGFGQDWLWPFTTALVWVLIHQLGYSWHDARVTAGAGAPGPDAAGTPRPAGGRRLVAGRRRGAALVAGGLVALVALTTVAGYPRSMVSVGDEGSNMLPTTPAIVAVAVVQLGLVSWAEPWLRRVRARPLVGRAVSALNGVALTVLVWHMTALVAAIAVFQALGGTLTATPTTGWWLQRPLWLALPGAVLWGLVGLFRRFEGAPAPGAASRRLDTLAR